jgi:hypothetical protein
MFYEFKKIIGMGFVFLEERMKIDHVIRESKNKNDDSPLIELNSNFEFASIYECKLISKIVKFSKIDLNSNFESADIESIPKVAEF